MELTFSRHYCFFSRLRCICCLFFLGFFCGFLSAAAHSHVYLVNFSATFLSALCSLLSSLYIALWSYIKKKALPSLTILCMLIKNVIFSLQKPFHFSLPNGAQGKLWLSYITAIWHYQEMPHAMENIYCRHL